MKRFLIIILFLLFLSIPHKSYSIDTNAVKYYPLAIGNSWTYGHAWYPYGGSYNYKETVTGTTVTNGHFYYIITTRIGNSQTTEFRRIDSVNNIVRVYSTSGCSWLQNEYSLDSLGAHLGDSSKFHCGSYNELYRLNDTSIITVFGLSKRQKLYVFSAFEDAGYRRLARDIGFFNYYDGGLNSLSIQLLGCVINGVLYGDTSLTGINQISTEIPKEYKLYQNYPNPFNPSTKIRFEAPLNKGGDRGLSVRLVIYDVLGKEVTNLVNEQLKPGTYETEFDGTNLPSGVYFYKLISSNYTETKRMVLLK